jgi:hypothetical protein
MQQNDMSAVQVDVKQAKLAHQIEKVEAAYTHWKTAIEQWDIDKAITLTLALGQDLYFLEQTLFGKEKTL